jgi:hypothetical protein
MLAICRQQQQQQPRHGTTSSSSSSSQEGADGSASCLSSPAEEALACFLQQLFAHEAIRVVGFGLQGDLQRLANSYPWLLAAAHASASSSSSSNGTSSDVQTLKPAITAQAGPGLYGSQSGQAADGAYTLVVNANAENALGTTAGAAVSEQTEGSKEKQAGCGWVVRQAVELQQLGSKGSTVGRRGSGQVGSLSRLVRQVLGKPLNKEQQASDWGLRPLSEAQLVYAANDAHVLTAVYDTLVADAAVDDPSCK